ncbi:hypothetical protein JCM8202_005256 [Rhodotorula sphaerocarpa]
MAKVTATPALRWAGIAACSLLLLVYLHSRRRSAVQEFTAGHTSQRDDVTEVLGIGRHSASIIFLHGLGGQVKQMMPVVDHMRPKLWQASWVMPTAPTVPITAVDGVETTAWFDMVELLLPKNPPMPKHEVEEDMHRSVKRVHALVEDEIQKGIDPERIVLGGFSQGCAIVLLAAMSSPHQLGGIMCLSGWLPLAYKIKNGKHPMQSERAHELPVFWGHGLDDNTIQHNWAEESIAHLTKMGFRDIEFHSYPGLSHWVEPFQYDDIENWLKKRVPPV